MRTFPLPTIFGFCIGIFISHLVLAVFSGLMDIFILISIVLGLAVGNEITKKIPHSRISIVPAMIICGFTLALPVIII